MKLKMNGMRLAPLPTGKTAVDVFGDFLSYLFHCTRSFIIDTHANGAALWRAVEHDIQFVLSHPNGWEGAQHGLRRPTSRGRSTPPAAGLSHICPSIPSLPSVVQIRPPL